MTHQLVRDIMTSSVITVTPTTPYKDIVGLLTRHRISAVPVVDADRRVLGVVSEADLVYKLEFASPVPQAPVFERKRVRMARERAAGTTAQDLMTSPAVTVLEAESIIAAARRMDSQRIKRLPVVNELGRLTGILARADVLRTYLREDAEIEAEIRHRVLQAHPPPTAGRDQRHRERRRGHTGRRAGSPQHHRYRRAPRRRACRVSSRSSATSPTTTTTAMTTNTYPSCSINPSRRCAMRGTYHIVVGVDGSDGSRRALRWAIHEARARRGTVQAITAWRWDTVGSGPGEAATAAQAQARAERILDEEVGAFSTSAGVAIAAEAVEGRAAPVLTAAARDADLLVLGSHGHSEVYPPCSARSLRSAYGTRRAR